MTLRPIIVECYAGARADERPRLVSFDGQEHRVDRLLAESIDESVSSRCQTRRYMVLTVEGAVLEVIRASDGSWYLES